MESLLLGRRNGHKQGVLPHLIPVQEHRQRYRCRCCLASKQSPKRPLPQKAQKGTGSLEKRLS